MMLSGVLCGWQDDFPLYVIEVLSLAFPGDFSCLLQITRRVVVVPSPPHPLKTLVARQLLPFQSVGAIGVASLFLCVKHINSPYSLPLRSAQSSNPDGALTSKGFCMELMLHPSKLSLQHPRNISTQLRGAACLLCVTREPLYTKVLRTEG